jgi:uncharacterized protein (TIGR00251 family)
MDALQLRERQDSVSFQVRVRPGSSRDAVGEILQGALKVHLTAPPVEGAANDSLTRLLARTLRVPKSSVAIVRGQRSKNKTVCVSGVNAAAVRRAFEAGK